MCQVPHAEDAETKACIKTQLELMHRRDVTTKGFIKKWVSKSYTLRKIIELVKEILVGNIQDYNGCKNR